MPQSKAEILMSTYSNLTPAERSEFRAMLTGYAMRDQPAQSAGKKAAETKKKNAAAAKEAGV